jgi:flagellar hook-associated protein 1 FlgK
MSGIFNTINVANKGLQASQTALHTTGHNISNANTEGFSRQRVELKASLAYTLGGVGQLGTGVKMENIIRVVDDYVNKQIRQENSTLSKFAVKSEVMEQLEIIFNEPSDTGLNFNLGEMFDAWQELSKNPESLNSKTIVVEKSKTMTDTLNHIASQLDSLKDSTIDLIEKNVENFNSIVQKLDALNKQIFNISVKGQVPNDLLDQRDLLLKDLSAIADFEINFNNYNRISVTVGGQEVLGLNGYTELAIDTTDVHNIQFTVDGKPVNFKNGTIAGYQDALIELAQQQDNLNNFAQTMATAINNAHGTPIFDNIDSAFTITVHDDIKNDNSKIIAGETPTSPEGDGSRALSIARLRNEKFAFKNGNNTIEGSYNDMVTKVGISKEQADNMVANQEVLLDQLVLRRESTSGVSIDEEVTNLIKFQKSYEANAKVISVLTEMLDVLINRTGV